MASKDWYGKGGKEGEKKGGEESMPERHARERGETHMRHASERADVNKRHEKELADMAERQSAEMASAAPAAAAGAPA